MPPTRLSHTLQQYPSENGYINTSHYYTVRIDKNFKNNLYVTLCNEKTGCERKKIVLTVRSVKKHLRQSPTEAPPHVVVGVSLSSRADHQLIMWLNPSILGVSFFGGLSFLFVFSLSSITFTNNYYLAHICYPFYLSKKKIWFFQTPILDSCVFELKSLPSVYFCLCELMKNGLFTVQNCKCSVPW